MLNFHIFKFSNFQPRNNFSDERDTALASFTIIADKLWNLIFLPPSFKEIRDAGSSKKG